MAKLALCIGINDYPGTDSDLAGCVNDANDWAVLLRKRGFRVNMILNRQASGSNIRKTMESLLSNAKRDDSVVIQYSGHGSFVPDLDGDEPDRTDECLCPYDIRKNGPILDDELYRILSQCVPGVRVVMISDSCHSGTVAKFAPISTPPVTRGKISPQRTIRFLPPAVYLPRRDLSGIGERRTPRRASDPGRHAALLMSGCQEAEYGYDAFFQGRPNGAFSFVAIRALSGLAPKSTYSDWFREIRRALPSRQYPQSPNLYGSSNMKKWSVLS